MLINKNNKCFVSLINKEIFDIVFVVVYFFTRENYANLWKEYKASNSYELRHLIFICNITKNCILCTKPKIKSS